RVPCSRPASSGNRHRIDRDRTRTDPRTRAGHRRPRRIVPEGSRIMPSAGPSRPSRTPWIAAALALVAIAECPAAELHVGGATASISPDRPVALAGQRHTRISRGVEGPVTATALALEAREGARVVDRAILVSCDLVAIGAP